MVRFWTFCQQQVAFVFFLLEVVLYFINNHVNENVTYY